MKGERKFPDCMVFNLLDRSVLVSTVDRWLLVL